LEIKRVLEQALGLPGGTVHPGLLKGWGGRGSNPRPESSSAVNGNTLQQVKQVVRTQPGRPWFPVIGRKRGAFRGPSWQSILCSQFCRGVSSLSRHGAITSPVTSEACNFADQRPDADPLPALEQPADRLPVPVAASGRPATALRPRRVTGSRSPTAGQWRPSRLLRVHKHRR
jgi:hypothetical protein